MVRRLALRSSTRFPVNRQLANSKLYLVDPSRDSSDGVWDIETGAVMSGQLPGRALALVREWHELHKSELQDDWELARQHQPLKKIAPLE